MPIERDLIQRRETLAFTSPTYGPKELLIDLTTPPFYMEFAEMAGKLASVYLWWAKEFLTHPIRAHRKITSTGEFTPSRKA